MSDCIFCRIVAGEAPASFVYRDELVSAFLDIRPITPGHVLVVPKEHVVYTQDLPGTIADRLFTVARGLARTLRQTDAVRADGITLFGADGEAAGQDVFHAHLHVVPRFPGDGFHIDATAWRKPQPTREELDALADRMGQRLSFGVNGSAPRIRTIVIGVAVRDDRVLAGEGYDPHKDERFYRPPGGGLEFGETSEDALRREFREELDVEIAELGYLGALENVFTFAGQPGHEIILVYRVALPDDERFRAETVTGQESDASPFTARWLPLSDVRSGAALLYPDGLLRLLDTTG